MNWNSIQENWNVLQGRVIGHWSEGADCERTDRDCEQYLRQHGVARDEACRKRRDWIKDPGVLDDWNDTRSILDM